LFFHDCCHFCVYFINFEIGDATVYSRVYKQLITEAKAITPYGMEIAAMLQDASDVDFNADRPTKETIVEADAEMKAIMEEQTRIGRTTTK
jgi:hypothetical protein